MVDAYIGLGANLGDRERTLWSGAWSIGLPIGANSSLYRSRPVETDEAQPDYLNAVIRLACPSGLSAEQLLGRLLLVERLHGRVRKDWHAARTLDLDLLAFGSETRRSKDLVLPHPGLSKRRFVLEPLLEVLASGRLADGSQVDALIAATLDQDVERIHGRSWLWRTRS